MQPGASQEVGDASLAHGGTENLQTAHDVCHELRKPVDWHRHLDQGRWPFLIEPRCPCSHRGRRDLHPLGSLSLTPTPGRPQLQDGQAPGGQVVGPSLGGDCGHSGILDAHLLLNKEDLLGEAGNPSRVRIG